MGYGAKSISVGERSWPRTRKVMELKGVLPVLQKLDVRVIDFDDLKEKDWVEFKPKVAIGQTASACPSYSGDECLVSTGCLKTHQFGGVFTYP